MSEALASQLEDLSLSDTEVEDVLDYTIVNVVAVATFADFSLAKFIARTGAEPPRNFPAATLRGRGPGVFSVFKTGKIVLSNLRSEAEARQALEDLARETGYRLAEAPVMANVTVETALHRTINLQALAAYVNRPVHMDRSVNFTWTRPYVRVYVEGNGRLRLYHAEDVSHVGETLALVRDMVSRFAASDCDE